MFRPLCPLLGIAGLLATAWPISSSPPAQRIPEATLRIQVVAADGGVVRAERYVALVPEDRPWEEPTEAAVVGAGSPVPLWRVPPGRYRVVCASPGLEVSYQPAFDLAAGAEHTETCSMRRLSTVSGRVLAGDKPVAGARVGLPHAFLDDFALKLSPQGEAFTRPDRSTVSDAEGRFRLLGLAAHRSAVWIEAEGLAPAYLADALFTEGGNLGDIRLSPGGSLDLSLELPAGFPTDRYVLALLPRRQAKAEEASRSLLIQRMRQRPVSPAVRWASLEPAGYRILLKGKPLGEHQDLPIDLGTVELAAGEKRSLKLAPPPVAQVPGALPPAASDLRLLSPASIGPKERFTAQLWRGQAGEASAVTWKPVSGGYLARIRGGCRKDTVLVLESGERVSSPIEAKAVDCSRPVPIQLFPAAEVAGRLRAPEGAPRPAAGLFRTALCGISPALTGRPVGLFPFAVGPEGTWSLKLPAGCLDVSLQAGDFAPVSYRSLKTEAGRRVDLGNLTLTYGAALLARIVEDAGGLPIEDAAVELVREEELAKTVSATYSRQGAPVVAVGRTGPGGWIRLAGLPGGGFHLRVTPRDGFPAFTDHFDLVPRLETLLDEVRLPSPAELSVTLEPSLDLAAEFEQYQVSLLGIAPEWLKAVQRGEVADEKRIVRFGQVPPGRWRLVATGRLHGPVQTLATKEIEILPGAVEAITLELDGKVFRGRVTYRGEPLEAVLDLRPIPQDGRHSARAASDPEGNFTLALEKGGAYTVLIAELRGNRHGAIPSVTFPESSRTVEIRLPEGQIEGVVIDATGEPVSGARVEAVLKTDTPSPFLPGRSRGGEQGSFRLEHLAPGEWILTAKLGDREGETVSVLLGEGETRTGVELVLSPAAAGDISPESR